MHHHLCQAVIRVCVYACVIKLYAISPSINDDKIHDEKEQCQLNDDARLQTMKGIIPPTTTPRMQLKSVIDIN